MKELAIFALTVTAVSIGIVVVILALGYVLSPLPADGSMGVM